MKTPKKKPLLRLETGSWYRSEAYVGGFYDAVTCSGDFSTFWLRCLTLMADYKRGYADGIAFKCVLQLGPVKT